ncbi:MAG TPA: molybdopterin-dependent oxidoreductase [Streptosporangiaceae bacterium]
MARLFVKVGPLNAAGAAAGILTAAAAVGVAQVVAGLTVPASSPVLAVGQAAIDHTPQPVKDFAISTFGADDKNVLLGGILVMLALFAAAIGAAAVRRLSWGLWGLGAFASLGLAAALTRPDANAEWVVPTLAGAAAGTLAMVRLARAAVALRPGAPAEPSEGTDPSEDTAPGELEEPAFTYLPNPDEPPPRRHPERRQFLVAGGLAVATAAVGTVAGRVLAERYSVAKARAALRFPAPAVPAPALPPDADLRIPGLSSFITTNDGFYRVDTTLLLPEVDPATWRLRIHGMVRREMVITFGELLKRPLIEDYVTLTCVSDPVSGPYVGNAKWLGASLPALIRSAGPLAGADQLLCTSVDGFTSGTPLAVVLDGRDALLAVAMNGTALPVAHGFPARMVVPGLYGYVSATKWVTDIEVTTFASAQAYWAVRGWAQQAPIKTESRIDVPASGASLPAGRTPVAGVAWAQHKGIAAVEVRADGGSWQQARLAAVPGIDTWRQWVWDWDASPGGHTLEARATDATGYTQTPVQVPTTPNGASGYPSVGVTVRQ